MTTLKALPPPVRRRLIGLALMRSLASIVALVVLYYLLPLDGHVERSALFLLIGGIVALPVLIVWQVRAIMRAPNPALKAIESLSVAVPLFLLIFSSAYFVIAHNQPASFSEPMGRTDGLYFTVTVFSTVGFGDITPVTQVARVFTIVQMIADVLVVGVLLRVIFTAVQIGQRRQAGGSGDDTTTGP